MIYKTFIIQVTLLISILVSTSCSSKSTQPEMITAPFMVDYSPILQTIQKLSKAGKKDLWLNEKYVQVRQIKNPADLDKALRYYGDESSISKNKLRRNNLLSSLEIADSSYHFGFEGDYHAIVFFNQRGNQISIYPEQN